MKPTFKQVYVVQRYSQGETSLGIISLTFLHLCYDGPDDGRIAETCCA
jgi:hypothetical protein